MVQLNHTHLFLKLQIYALSFGKDFQRIMRIPRNSPTYSMNNAKFAPFMYPLYLMFQIHATAENSLKFQRIRQNLLNSPTDAVNDAKFAPIINPFILCFRGLPRQRTLRNSSELCKFRAIHPQLPRIT